MIIDKTHTPWRLGMALVAIALLATGCPDPEEENNDDNTMTQTDMETPGDDMEMPGDDMETPGDDMETPDEDMPADMPPVDEDMPEDMPIDEDMPEDMDEEDMAPDAIIDEAEPNDDLETDTIQSIAPGEAVRGSIGEFDGSADPDIDIFRVTLSAGDVYEWQIAEVGAGISANGVAANLYTETGDIVVERYLSSADSSDTRQAFIPEDGDYLLAVFDMASAMENPENHGGADATYQVNTRLGTLSPAAIDVPGMATGDLSDGDIDAFTFTYSSDETFKAEVFGSRDPINSSIDPVLFIWDVADGSLVATNDDIDAGEGLYDSELLSALENGKEYYVVLDGWTIGDDTAYQLVTSTTSQDADSPQNPTPLTAGDTITAGIGDADAASEVYDTDYYNVTLQPGETFKISAQATGSMIQPRVSVLADSIFGFITVASGRSVEGLAAVSFNNPTDAQANDYFVLVDDEANILTDEDDMPDYTGGAEYGYTLTTESITWTPTAQTFPVDIASTYAAPGEYAWYDVPVTAESVIVLSASSTTASPFVAWFDPVNGLAADLETLTYLPTTAGNRIFGTRDEFFRGDNGAISFDFSFSAVSYDYGALTFVEVDEVLTNNDAATPQVLVLPALVSAETQQYDTTNMMPAATPTNDYYSVTATAGQKIIVFTEQGPDAPVDANGDPDIADTVVTVLDANGTEIGTNDDLLTDDFSTFSALVVEAPADGVYTIEVKPFSDSDSTNGAYDLRVFVQ